MSSVQSGQLLAAGDNAEGVGAFVNDVEVLGQGQLFEARDLGATQLLERQVAHHPQQIGVRRLNLGPAVHGQ
ncbi:hypothetical protein [Caulobacter segnis]|uniref:hypothetical protein n=1 Tax=Caulobacter segnis TaxID=88688 RepID=UPI0038572D2F